MATYVERLREITSTQSDDYFEDDTLLFYLNKAQQNVVSTAISFEQNNKKTLRLLDKLRKYVNLSVNGLTFTPEGGYYVVEVPFPSNPSDEINQFVFAKYDVNTVMRELSPNNLVTLYWGNLSPDTIESYYNVVYNGSNTVFELFLPEDDSGTSKVLRVYYIVNPTDLILADETLTDLPNRIDNAILYKAASMLVRQEISIESNKQTKDYEAFEMVYREELQNNLY